MAKTEIKEKIEREYIIPLRREWLKTVRHKRAKKAITACREFLARHMKTDIKNVKLGKWLNQILWARGIKKPLGKVKVKVVKEGDIVRAELSELSEYNKKIDNKEKAKIEASKKTKKEIETEAKKVEEVKKIEETAKEELKEEIKEKEKKAEEKIMHHHIDSEKANMPKDLNPEGDKHPGSQKPFRQALKK